MEKNMYEFFQIFLLTLLVHVHDMCTANPCVKDKFPRKIYRLFQKLLIPLAKDFKLPKRPVVDSSNS
jgi:hypothetical protein